MPVIPDALGFSLRGIDFGNVSPGATSNAGEGILANSGTIGVRITKTTVTGPFAVVPGGTCATTPLLNPTKNCTIKVVFKPVSTGPAAGELVVDILAPEGAKQYRAPLTGGSAVGALAFDPPVIDLGIGPVGELAGGTMTLRNTGSAPVKLVGLEFGPQSTSQATPQSTPPVATPKTSKGKKGAKPKPTKVVTLSPGALKLLLGELNWDKAACVGAPIAPGATCTVNFTIKPRAAVTRSFTLVAKGATGENASVLLKRTAAVPNFSLTPVTVDFSKLNGKPTTLTVKNTGKLPLTFESPLLAGADKGQFVIDQTTCSASTPLVPGKTCTLRVRSLASVGVKGAQLSVAAKAKLTRKAALKFSKVEVTTSVAPPSTTTIRATIPKTVPATVAAIPEPVVTTTAVTVPPTVSKFEPELRMSPAVGPTGRVTFAIGSGFPQNQAISLKWSNRPGTFTAKTDGEGAFRVPILVMSGEAIGGRMMIAVGQDAFDEVSAPYLVQLPTFRPPGGNGRNDQMVARA